MCLKTDTTEGHFVFWSKTRVCIQPPSRRKMIQRGGLGRGLLRSPLVHSEGLEYNRTKHFDSLCQDSF